MRVYAVATFSVPALYLFQAPWAARSACCAAAGTDRRGDEGRSRSRPTGRRYAAKRATCESRAYGMDREDGRARALATYANGLEIQQVLPAELGQRRQCEQALLERVRAPAVRRGVAVACSTDSVCVRGGGLCQESVQQGRCAALDCRQILHCRDAGLNLCRRQRRERDRCELAAVGPESRRAIRAVTRTFACVHVSPR